MGCVASQMENSENTPKKGKTKTNNIKILVNKLKITKPDDKQHLINDENENFKESNEDLKTNERLKGRIKTQSNDAKVQMPAEGVKTFVEVVNGDIRKKFMFKNAVKVVNGEKYMCKMGYNEQNALFFVRCMLIGYKSSDAEDNTSGQRSSGDDIAAFLEAS